MNLGDYTSARAVTGKALVGGLQAGGIDASKIEKQNRWHHQGQWWQGSGCARCCDHERGPVPP